MIFDIIRKRQFLLEGVETSEKKNYNALPTSIICANSFGGVRR